LISINKSKIKQNLNSTILDATFSLNDILPYEIEKFILNNDDDFSTEIINYNNLKN
jgi:hypothetical protein